MVYGHVMYNPTVHKGQGSTPCLSIAENRRINQGCFYVTIANCKNTWFMPFVAVGGRINELQQSRQIGNPVYDSRKVAQLVERGTHELAWRRWFESTLSDFSKLERGHMCILLTMKERYKGMKIT